MSHETGNAPPNESAISLSPHAKIVSSRTSRDRAPVFDIRLTADGVETARSCPYIEIYLAFQGNMNVAVRENCVTSVNEDGVLYADSFMLAPFNGGGSAILPNTATPP